MNCKQGLEKNSTFSSWYQSLVNPFSCLGSREGKVSWHPQPKFLPHREAEWWQHEGGEGQSDGCLDDWVISHNKILLCLAKPVSSVLWTSVLASSSTYGLDLLLIHICQTQTKYHQILRWKCCPVFYIFLFKGTAGCSSVQSVQEWVVIYRISGSLSVLVRVAPLK